MGADGGEHEQSNHEQPGSRIGARERERLGSRVKQERLARGLAYRDAAARAGVAPATWLRIEHGDVVRDAQLGRVAAAFGWSAEELRRFHSGTDSNVERLDALERDVAELRATLQDLVDQLRVRRPELRRRLPSTTDDP